MYVIRETFTAKPGMASKLARLFSEVSKEMPGPKSRILTDFVGQYNTVVWEMEVNEISDFEKMMKEYAEKPDLGKKKSLLGPALPLIYVINGKFFPDASPTIRTSEPSVLPSGTPSATFEATFRLPFKVGKNGVPAKTERGENAYYLGDDGSLIKADKQDEFAQGFPLLRAEVFFK